MKLYYDFHIHTGFSPCGSEDMSPNNIVNMSLIKELDVIAITDHNGIGNVRVTVEVGKQLGLMVIPGIEVQTIEDIHSVVLFETLEAIEGFYEVIKNKRMLIKNKPEKFGYQILFNELDEVIGHEENYLITPFNMSIQEMIECVRLHGGVLFPAHINRKSFSILSSLGFIDPSMPIENIEWYQGIPEDKTPYKRLILKNYRELVNSDAHDLVSISERENYLEVEERSIKGILDTLRKPL